MATGSSILNVNPRRPIDVVTGSVIDRAAPNAEFRGNFIVIRVFRVGFTCLFSHQLYSSLNLIDGIYLKDLNIH